jgi:hypothetical protein
MAESFSRKPIPGGDLDAWATYNDTEHLRSYGINTAYLFSDAGTLKLSPGQIGINNGTLKGTITITANYSFSLVGLTASRWAQIELVVAGAVVTPSIASIAAGSDAKVLPTAFTGSYNGQKGGFYINATKRCIGLVWINAGGALEGIITCG